MVLDKRSGLLVYHAPLGVVLPAAGVKVDVLPVELGVVHVSLLHDLVREKQLKLGRTCIPPRGEELTVMIPAIPGSLQLLW